MKKIIIIITCVIFTGCASIKKEKEIVKESVKLDSTYNNNTLTTSNITWEVGKYRIEPQIIGQPFWINGVEYRNIIITNETSKGEEKKQEIKKEKVEVKKSENKKLFSKKVEKKPDYIGYLLVFIILILFSILIFDKLKKLSIFGKIMKIWKQ